MVYIFKDGESSMNEEVVGTRVLRVAELKEETVKERLSSLLHSRNPEISTKSSPQAVDIHLCVHASTHEEGEHLLAQTEGQIREVLGDYIFGTGEITLQEIIGAHLDEQKLTIATMESLTGGLIGSALTDVHGSSAHFIGGIVSYSTLLKERIGVSKALIEQYGVISEETAKAMAHAIRKFLDTDIGLGITGVAGPDTQEDKPVGTVHIAIEGPYGIRTYMGSECCAGPDREENKQAATISALNFLRIYVEHKGEQHQPR